MNTYTLIPDFNYLMIDRDDEILNTSQNIINDGKSKVYREVISGHMGDLCYSPIEAEITTLLGIDTWDMVHRPTDKKIVDCKSSLEIKHLADGSIDKFKPGLLVKGFYQM
jgi:hypothetical protein